MAVRSMRKSMKKFSSNVTVKVIDALAGIDGLEPTELEFNLSDHMDPDVLEKLGAMEGGVWELTFRVSDHQVRITHEGQIFVDGVKYAADARQ